MTALTFSKYAITEARRCKPEDDRCHPFVAVVIVRDDEIIGSAYRGELGPGEHAEFTLLEKKLKDVSLVGATVYTTLEPCTSRSHPKVPCVERLIERKVKRVVIGQLDPDPRIHGNGLLRLRNANVEIELFPSSLAAELEALNRDFTRQFLGSPAPLAGEQDTSTTAQPKNNDSVPVHRYRETVYDALAHWYDVWYKGHWHSDEPYLTLLALIRSYFDAKKSNLSDITILDCACGTGNTFAAFTRHGYHAYGTDGSQEMLTRARQNCVAAGISTDRLVDVPINWTDGETYDRVLGAARFDVIVNTANSLCHIPPVPQYMGVALRNFHRLLKPGGLLVVDTKRYVRSDPEDGVETFRELKFVGDIQEWIVRSEREEESGLAGLGAVRFHTRMFYDNDPSFGIKIPRALIVLTVYGAAVTPRVIVIPYYPLPAHKLAALMGECGFNVTVFPGMAGLTANWRYDVVIGKKPPSG